MAMGLPLYLRAGEAERTGGVMYAVSSSRTEQGIQFRAALRRQQEQERLANEAAARRLAIVNQRRHTAAEVFERSRELYREATTLSGRPSVRQIIMAVAKEYGVAYGDIVGHARTSRILAARHKAVLLAKLTYRDISLPKLGKHFNKHHTSILNALRKMGYYDTLELDRTHEGSA